MILQSLSISIVIFVISLSIGLFIFLKPVKAIEIQKKFYEKINWRIEPISLQKEIRNTKMMGLFLVVLTTGTVIYLLIFTRLG